MAGKTKSRMSGGEDKKAEAFRQMRVKIGKESDVHAIVALSWVPVENRWLYYIKTPFSSWPKFVVGYTDDENENPEVVFRCGREDNAMEKFDELQHMGGTPMSPRHFLTICRRMLAVRDEAARRITVADRMLFDARTRRARKLEVMILDADLERRTA